MGRRASRASDGTGRCDEWERFKRAQPGRAAGAHRPAAGRTTQAAERDDILNVGGFSDQVFEIVAEFAAGRLRSGHWVERIDQVTL